MAYKIEIEQLLPKADKALKDKGIVDGNGRVVKKEYEGYIAGFGANVINLGIKAALAFYMKDFHDTTLVKRSNVIAAIFHILYPELEIKKCVNKIIKAENENELHQYTKEIVNASIALKLMIRTYEIPNRQEGDRQ